ncbi:hypothetical protein [Streptomyces sp. CNQ085]|uniref:hypothetical protein n=1 Tax=Streptomyces sp. CNQ085 TaxID=2886944 RepID=UPI001F50AD15|nr:hypothetical protein [Streptomyces sp. CNQ085]MCI0382957.1 hypothetical protein [Streptomyces sp. CNQ085]
MNGTGRRKLWMYVVGVVTTVAPATVGIFTIRQIVGGSSNDGSRVGVPGQGE